jgi:hypothetical protein
MTTTIISIGGDKRVVGNAELLFPFPGAGNDRSLRMSCSRRRWRWGPAAAFNDFDWMNYATRQAWR